MIARFMWSIPATLAGLVACSLWVMVYFGSHLGPFPSWIGIMFLVHFIAWIFVIVPFSLVVPVSSRLYEFRYSLAAGALLAVLAFIAYALIVEGIQGRIPKLHGILLAYPLIIGCIISGMAVAATMSLLRSIFHKSESSPTNHPA